MNFDFVHDVTLNTQLYLFVYENPENPAINPSISFTHFIIVQFLAEEICLSSRAVQQIISNLKIPSCSFNVVQLRWHPHTGCIGRVPSPNTLGTLFKRLTILLSFHFMAYIHHIIHLIFSLSFRVLTAAHGLFVRPTSWDWSSHKVHFCNSLSICPRLE